MWDTKRRLLISADLTSYSSLLCGYVRKDRIIDKDNNSRKHIDIVTAVLEADWYYNSKATKGGTVY